MNTPSEGKSIVICSDGTWAQGGSSTPTNVWRTYLVVDPEGQEKIHDDGIGTGGFRFGRIIGGATGFGISRNLRELLFQLSLCYRPGDRIYLFGFSRGAYTVRVLANLICMFGVPDSRGRSPAEVKGIAADLLGAYKYANEIGKTVLATPNPNVAGENATEATQSLELESQKNASSKATLLKQDKLVQSLRGKCHTTQGEEFAVHFLGCWDTVDAVGVPIKPLKRAIAEWFPLRFSNQYPSPKIKHLYQALALDEERQTFHAIPWEVPPGGLATGQVMEQVWFPGCHSHVGGSYPKDQLALEALEWMLEKASHAELKLQEDVRSRFRSEAYNKGQLVDSRTGLSQFYRYYPRTVSRHMKSDEHCTIHASAADRIASQTYGYAPHGIDVKEVTVVDNQQTIRGANKNYQTTHTLPQPYLNDIRKINRSYMPLGRLLHVAGYLMIFGFIFFAYCNRYRDMGLAYHATEHDSLFIPSVIKFVGSFEHVLLNMLKGTLPSFIGNTIVQGLLNLPGTLTAFSIVFAAYLYLCNYLRNKIRELSSIAWHQSGFVNFATGYRDDEQQTKISKANKGWLRTLKSACFRAADAISHSIIQVLLPLGAAFQKTTDFIDGYASVTTQSRPGLVKPVSPIRRATWICMVVAAGALLVAFGVMPGLRSMNHDFHGYEREQSRNYPASLIENGEQDEDGKQSENSEPEIMKATVDFTTSSPSYPTGVYVEKGESYQVRILEANNWKDLDIDASHEGIRDPDDEKWFHYGRRVAGWKLFCLVGQIDRHPLLIDLGKKDSTKFVAHTSGQLFLFVNDVPGYYGNNHGTAKIEICKIDPDNAESVKAQAIFNNSQSLDSNKIESN